MVLIEKAAIAEGIKSIMYFKGQKSRIEKGEA